MVTTRTPRVDPSCLRLQLDRLDGDAVLFERLRTQVQDIAGALLGQTNRLIVQHFTAYGVMQVARLYESPFTDNAPKART